MNLFRSCTLSKPPRGVARHRWRSPPAPRPARTRRRRSSRSAQAMGSASLKTLRYAGAGTGFTFGQAYTPGGAWPKITVHSMTRTIDYDTGAMRDEIVLSRAEPLGGGGYPLVGPAAQRPVRERRDRLEPDRDDGRRPGPRFVTDRIHQLWITPHGAIKAAQRNSATRRGGSGDGAQRASRSAEPGRFSATVYIGADGLVERVDSRRRRSGARRHADGHDATRTTATSAASSSRRGCASRWAAIRCSTSRSRRCSPTPPADIDVPEAARNAAERVTVEKVAAGVWFVAGGSHNSVAIEMARSPRAGRGAAQRRAHARR